MSLKGMLIIAIVLIGIISFGYWRRSVAGQPQPVAQFAIIQDTSDSIQADCGRIVGLAERAINRPETGEGSTISLLSLGDKSTANEPQLLGEFRVPVIHLVIEGQRASNREKQELLSNIKSRCADIGEIKVSPIFQAVKRGVEHLQTIGNIGDARYLFVQTDGEETENLQIKSALNSASSAKLKLPSPIKNKGVNVIFCGMAETVGEITDNNNKVQQKSRQRDSNRADRIREVWQQVFTNPELVKFEPYCSR